MEGRRSMYQCILYLEQEEEDEDITLWQLSAYSSDLSHSASSAQTKPSTLTKPTVRQSARPSFTNTLASAFPSCDPYGT